MRYASSKNVLGPLASTRRPCHAGIAEVHARYSLAFEYVIECIRASIESNEDEEKCKIIMSKERNKHNRYLIRSMTCKLDKINVIYIYFYCLCSFLFSPCFLANQGYSWFRNWNPEWKKNWKLTIETWNNFYIIRLGYITARNTRMTFMSSLIRKLEQMAYTIFRFFYVYKVWGSIISCKKYCMS